jgi:hypothetical protein
MRACIIPEAYVIQFHIKLCCMIFSIFVPPDGKFRENVECFL